MKVERPLISVIIPTIGQSPHLRGLLERLQRQKFAAELHGPELLFEVLVIANIPRQDLRNVVKSMDRTPFGVFEYLETGKLGVNLARNKGLERATGEIILFLDDDAILEELTSEPEYCLQRYYEKHREYPQAIAIGGPYRLVGATSKWDIAYQHIAAQWIRMHRRARNHAEQLLGGNLSFKLDQLRLLNERFDEVIPYGGAETGLCQRLAEQRQTLLFFDDLVIGHAPGMSRSSFMRKAYLQGAGAAWRQSHVGQSRFVGPDTLRPRDPLPDVETEIQTYDRCFRFGWFKRPFQNDLVRNSALEFPKVGFALFLVVTSLKNYLTTWPIAAFRRFYASARSIWISARY